jgi:gas vesicle protein
MSKQNRAGVFVSGMIVGSAIGTIIGLLIAPRTGKETRKVLKKSADALPDLAEDLSTSLLLQADRFSESALKNWDETLMRLKEAIAAGLEASELEIQKTQNSSEIPPELNSSLADNNH